MRVNWECMKPDILAVSPAGLTSAMSHYLETYYDHGT